MSSCREKISLVCPTINRQDLLKNVVERYRYDFIKVIILDGTKTVWDEAYKLNQTPNIVYIHSPNKDLHERLMQGADMIETPFAMLISDDDFVFPSTLQRWISLISKDNSSIGVVGPILGVRRSEKTILGLNSFPFSHTIYRRLGNNLNIISKFKNHFYPYEPLITWALLDSEIFKIATQNSCKCIDLKVSGYMESIFVMNVLSMGNIYYDKQIFMLRFEDTPPERPASDKGHGKFAKLYSLIDIVKGKNEMSSEELINKSIKYLPIKVVKQSSISIIHEAIKQAIYGMFKTGRGEQKYKLRILPFHSRIYFYVKKIIYRFLYTIAFKIKLISIEKASSFYILSIYSHYFKTSLNSIECSKELKRRYYRKPNS